jgi:TPR repeat protein
MLMWTTTGQSHWYLEAARQGNAGAIRGVGQMYELGQGGVLKDLERAAELYMKAAGLGDLIRTIQFGRTL